MMVSGGVRTAHTVCRSRSWSSAVPEIWRSLGGSLSSAVLQYRSCSDEDLDGDIPPILGPSFPTGTQVETTPSEELQQAVQKAQKFGGDRRNECSLRKWEGSRVHRTLRGVPNATFKPHLTRTALNEKESPVGLRIASNEAQELCREQGPQEGLVYGKELPMGSTYAGGNIHMLNAYSTSEAAIAILKHRQQQGLHVHSYMFIEILKRCSKQKDLVAARQVHECIIHSGMDKHPYVVTTLLNVYIKCGRLPDARLVFDGLEKTDRNVITWTVMIGEYAKRGCGMEAYRLFLQMKREGVIPDAITYMSILNTSASEGALQWVKEVHGDARRAGMESDLRVGSAIVHMYSKSGSISDARAVFDRLKARDVTTWSMMIGAYAESGCGLEAYRLFLQMKREGFVPNPVTYLSILNASASAGALEWVKEVHGHARRAGLESDLRVGGAIIHMYAKSGSIDDARLVFDRMEKRDVVTWNTMIGGLAQHGCGREALELFREMNAKCVKPSGISFVAVLSACCHSGLLDDGRRLFLAMTQDYGIEPTVVHYNCMVDLLGRAGHLEEAKLFIFDMPFEPNAITWAALLGACRTYSNVELGELAAKELLKLEPKNSSACVLLSNIYAAAGKWEKVSLVRTMMQERGVRKEPGRSRIVIDSKIHEFVVGDTAHPDARAIYGELENLTGKLRAEGYIPDTNLVLQNIDEVDKELALCSHSEKLAIAYGLLRIPCGEPIRVYKNLRVCSDCHTATKFISKVTGREIIARDASRFHHFKDGVCSCGDYW